MTAGKVYLVGAGPGDPGLLTLRGAEVMRQADVVLYDGLVNTLLLRHTQGLCVRTARTRNDGGNIVAQEEVNARLITEAEQGRTVVRLKGGDPFIFGRGSEEAAALEAAGIDYEVIPGITAATAAGDYAGFSFTHRDIASAVAFVTGHEDPSRETSRLDFSVLAAFPGTLVFYMGLGRISAICADLQAHGKAAETPAAVITRASLPEQQVVVSTLRELPKAVRKAGLRPPSLIVVGDCVQLRRPTSWFERLPLFGLSIGVTRPSHQCDEVISKIVSSGGRPVLMPLIEINDVDDAQRADVQNVLERLSDYDWIVFTSANGIEATMRYLWDIGRDARAFGGSRLAAIGDATAAALKRHGLRADVVPEAFRAEQLADALKSHVEGRRVLWLRANRGRDVLPRMLKAAGAEVDECVVYRNDDVRRLSEEVVQMLKEGRLHWIGLSSPSIARQLVQLLKKHGLSVQSLSARLAAISPVTAEAAREAGLEIAAVAGTYTWDGLLAAIAEAEASQ